MRHKLLFKLVWDGLKSNRKTVGAYILVSAVTVMLYYIMESISQSQYLMTEGEALFFGAEALVRLLKLGSKLAALIAVLFLLYGNRFVARSRKKELGLYSVLGLSRKSLIHILLLDSLLQGLAVLGLALLVGSFLNKLMLLSLYKVVRQKPVSGLLLSGPAIRSTLIIFGTAFLVCFLSNLFSLRLGNLILLLRSERTGEREPRVKLGLFLIGSVALGSGYYLAWTATGSFQALLHIFLSIVLVILGTYLLFTAGSIFLLKQLKRNKRFYYQTKHFISLSNLIFRMKHNAAGLASICILSTAVMFLSVNCVSLAMLGEQNINAMFPSDLMLHTHKAIAEAASDYEACFQEALQSSGVDATAIVCRQYACLSASAEGGELLPVNPKAPTLAALETLYVLTLEDYNAYTGAEAVLEEGELLNYSSGAVRSAGAELRLFGKSFRVRNSISPDGLNSLFDASMSLFDKEILVVRDAVQLEALQALDPTVSPSERGQLTLFLGADFSHTPSAAQKSAFAQRIREQFGESDISYKTDSSAFFYTVYGGIFFIGIYLAILFLIVTVVIIYYKQISEGLEDRVQFQILSNTGLTEQEAKAVIRSQVRLVFFLPVGSAIVHILVSGRIVKQFLQALVPVDAAGFAMSIALVCSAFFGVYALVYKLSAKQYYEIVYGKAENQRASVQKTCSGN